jgi:protocatechuate 3,4-dioxygenase beta subunit
VGTVRDAATGRPLAGARIEITAAARFEKWLHARAAPHGAQWDEFDERPDRVLSAADGRFLFVDLPAGRYTIVATLPDAGTRYGTAHANARVADKATEIPTVELALPATTLAGTVKGPGAAPVALARVTVEGSGESTLTDADGAFTLAGIETGTRAVRADGKGFAPSTRRVKVATAGAKKAADLRLDRAS